MHYRLLPFKRCRLLVMSDNKLIDRLSDFLRRSKARTAQRFPAQDAEPTFDLVQPGGIRRGVMEMNLGMGPQPAVLLGLVRIQIVENHMNLALRIQGHDFVHKMEKFAPTPPGVVSGFDFAGQHVQGGKCGCLHSNSSARVEVRRHVNHYRGPRLRSCGAEQ